MEKYLNPALLPILFGLVAGLIVGVTLIETTPPILGWFFGIGMGLMGGAFVAAVTSGDSIIGGPSSRRGRRNDAPWLDPAEDDR